MIKKYQKNSNIGVGLGILLQVFGIISDISILVSIGMILIVWGVCSYAMAKGYEWYIGLIAGLFSLLGLIVLFFLPDKHKEKKIIQSQKEENISVPTELELEKKIKKLTNFISLILDTAGAKLSEKDKRILFSKRRIEELKNLDSQEKKCLGNFYINLHRGYMLLAIKGYEFTNIDRVEEKFKLSLEENYPEASEPFIKFAKTYWTFQICLLEDFIELTDHIAYLYLADLHANIASVFFPMPGPATIPGDEREKTQREILKGFDIDIEDFIKGNPILIRDRQRGI